jgi:hypothetical protein
MNRFAVRKSPATVVERSMYIARDFLDGIIGHATGTTRTLEDQYANATTTAQRSNVRLRPWLEDFFHEADASAGRPAYKEKIRLQIDAAERSENHGWLLWNAANVYTEDALKKE